MYHYRTAIHELDRARTLDPGRDDLWRWARTVVRADLVQTARQSGDLDPGRARRVRVIEYEVPGQGEGGPEVICLLTTLGDAVSMLAGRLVQAYQQRWESAGANAELKSSLRGPGRMLRSHRPDMVRQEIYGDPGRPHEDQLTLSGIRSRSS